MCLEPDSDATWHLSREWSLSPGTLYLREVMISTEEEPARSEGPFFLLLSYKSPSISKIILDVSVF